MRSVTPLQLNGRDRLTLEAIVQSTTAPSARAARQAAALLMSAEGVASHEIATRIGVSPNTVRSWRRSFEKQGVSVVGHIERGRGRKPSLSEALVSEVVRLTLHELPANGGPRWTTRTLADHVGISKDSVARIWAEHALAPWRSDQPELPHTPGAKAITVDLLGLHFDPPIALAIFTVDRATPTVHQTRHDATPSPRGSREERMSALAHIAAALRRRGDDGAPSSEKASAALLQLLHKAKRGRSLGVGIHILVVEAAMSLTPDVATWLRANDMPPWYQHPSHTLSQWGQEVLQWLARMDERAGSTTATTAITSLSEAFHSWSVDCRDRPRPFQWAKDIQPTLAPNAVDATRDTADERTGDESEEVRQVETEATSSPEVVAEKLRAAILYGELAPGEHVRQPQWASRLGVSRTVLREAFKMLAGQRLLRHDPQSGYFVAKLSLSEMRQLYRLTAIVEEDVFLHIRWPTRRELVVIEEQFDNYQGSFLDGDISTAVGYWRQYLFHLYELSSETFLVAEARRLWEIATPYRMIVFATMLLQDPDLTEIQEARDNQMHALRTQDRDAFIRSIVHDRLPAFDRYATHNAIRAFFRRESSS